jgi:predicted nuclease with TOPRIM domain
MDLFTILGSGGVVTLILAIFKFIENRKSLKENRPKVNAESDLLQEQARKLGLESQNGIIAGLEHELTRQREERNLMEARLTKKIADLEAKVDEVVGRLEEAQEQNDLLAKANEASEADKALLRQEVAALRQQNAILRESSQQASDWQQRHSDPDDPPPTFHAI